MGEKKSNSGNGKRQNNKSLQDDVNNQDEKIIVNINEEDKNPNEGTSTAQTLTDTSDTTNNFDIKSLADKAVNLNILRFELDRLQLDFKAKAYFENDIRPLIDTLYTLSYASINYSTTAKNMASINFGHSSKIKEALDLVEEVDEISEDLIELLGCKIDNMLKLSKYDCK